MEPEFRSMAEQRRHEWLLNQREAALLQEPEDEPCVVDARPYKKVQTVAFDVDGCLIDEFDRPRRHVIGMLWDFYELGWEVFIWSGSGVDYARTVARRLGLDTYVGITTKGRFLMDVAFDDQDVTLGKANIRI